MSAARNRIKSQVTRNHVFQNQNYMLLLHLKIVAQTQIINRSGGAVG